jgi:L-2-hydroxyglutarate oxidase
MEARGLWPFKFSRMGCSRNVDFSRILESYSKNFVSGLGEMKDSIFCNGYLKRVRKYCPGLSANDLLSYPAGIRAQAVKNDGSLIHDFLFAQSKRSLHVCNAPSPAATAAIPIGRHLCKKFTEIFKL